MIEQSIINRSPAVVFLWKNEKGLSVKYVSENVKRLSGYTSKEFISRQISYTDIIYPEDLDRAVEEVRQYSRQDKRREFSQEYRIITKKGEIKWLDVRTYIKRNPDGSVIHFEGIILDITKRKETEEALKQSEEKLDAMLQSIGDHISLIDRDLNIVWANDTAMKVFGNNIIGKKCHEVYHREKEPCLSHSCFILQTFQDGKIREKESEVIDKKGNKLSFHCVAKVALKDEKGKPVTVLEVSRDITAQKRAEEALRLQQFSINNASISIFWITPEGKFVYVNDAACQKLGYSRKELLEMGIKDIDPDFPADRRPGHWKKFTQKKVVTLETRHRAKNGRIFPMEVTSHYLQFNGEEYEFAFAVDVTGRKKAEEEARRKTEEMKTLHELGKKLNSIASKEEMLPWIASHAAKLLGVEVCNYRIREGDYLVRGGGTTEGLAIMKKERLKIGESVSGLIALEKKPVVVEDIRDDQRYIKEHRQVAVSLGFTSFLGVPMMREGEVMGVLNLLSKKKRKFTKGDVELLTSFADMTAIALENARLFEDLQEAKREVELFGEDMEQMVEERTKELMELHNQLIHSERLAATGRLSASIAHEINNPLQAIDSFISSVINESDEASRHVEYLKLAQEGIYQIAGIVKQLLAFSRPGKEVRTAQDINPIIEQTLAMLKKELLRSKIKCIEELSEDLPKVRVSSQQMNQIFVNLILNARDAMPEGGEINIRTGKIADYVFVEVSDKGKGMSEEVMNRMYEPFFTTKKGKGSGLGLSVSYGIIRSHGGDLIVESKENVGTTFTMKLPVNGAQKQSLD